MNGPAEISLSELVPLMYRARWLRFFLSGQVSSREESPDGAGWDSGSMLAAPGGRCRAETVDEDGDRDLVICDGRTGMVPFGELLIPSRLLAGYDLAVTDRAEHIGRTAYEVRATRRGGRPRTGWQADRVTALVDAELGILLRYKESSQTVRGREIGVHQPERGTRRIGRSAAIHPVGHRRPRAGQPRARRG